MIIVGFLVGFLVVAPIAFALGVCAALDHRRSHEPADIRPALRRSVK